MGKSRGHLPWQESGEAPDNQAPPQGHSKKTKNERATADKTSTTRTVRSSALQQSRPSLPDTSSSRAVMPSPGTSA